MQLTLISAVVATLFGGSAFARVDIDAGHREFDRTCRLCHSTKPEEIAVGPSLAGIFGRRAGSVAAFAYSEPIRRSNIVWTETTLDAYLADPAMMGTEVNMCIPGISDPEERANLIEYMRRTLR